MKKVAEQLAKTGFRKVLIESEDSLAIIGKQINDEFVIKLFSISENNNPSKVQDGAFTYGEKGIYSFIEGLKNRNVNFEIDFIFDNDSITTIYSNDIKVS